MDSIRNQDLQKFEDLFQIYSKTEPHFLKFPELLQMLIEKKILSNKIGFQDLVPLYLEANAWIPPVKEQPPEQTIQKNPKQKVKKVEKPKEELLEEQKNLSMMNSAKYIYFMQNLAKVMYPWDQTRMTNFIQHIWPENNVKGKSMHFDENNKRILDESVIRFFIQYQKHLEYIFTIYVQDNIDNKSLLLSWREIMLQNKKLTCISLVKFLIDSMLVPRILSIDAFQDIMRKVLPSHSQNEHQFYLSEQLIKTYQKEQQKITQKGPIPGDPGCTFWEFQIIIMKIAFESISKEQQQEFNKEPSKIIEIITTFLNLQDNDTFEQKQVYQTPTPFQLYQMQMSQAQITQMVSKKQNETVKSTKDQIQSLNIKYRLDDEIQDFDWEELYKLLDKELPPIPEEIQVHKQNPDQIKKKEFVIIGEQPPKPPKEKAAAKQAKKANKEEKPKRPIIWEGMPQPQPPTSEVNIFAMRDQQEYGPTGPSDMKVATLSDMEPLPVIIKEVLYPQSIPFETRTYVEAAIQLHLDNSFALSLENFALARKQWTLEESPNESNELFLLFSEGQVYESANREDIALSKFLQCKTICEKLPVGIPDRAIPYCGIGSVFYNMEEYEMSLRCFLMARQIRENSLGEDTADVATCYNNIGCCFYCMERNKEALAYFKLSQAIFEAELGIFHSRTAIAKQNMHKCQRQAIKLQPEYKTLWKIYEFDMYKKKKGGKKKKKK